MPGDYHARLAALAARRPATLLVQSRDGDADGTYRAWLALLDR